jgi:TPR repeat protein
MKKIFILFILFTFTSLNANNYQAMALSAERGNLQAQYDLGLLYKTGKAKNLKYAFRWMHKSALKGYTPAQYEFALMFHYGIGVRKNSELARLWFRRAAKRGDSRAKSILYRFYSGKKVAYIGQKHHKHYSQNFRTLP